MLHGKILPCGVLDGFTVKLGASGLFMPKQVVLPVTTFWFNVSEHQAASPYLVSIMTLDRYTFTFHGSSLNMSRILSRVSLTFSVYLNVVIIRRQKEQLR